MLGLVQHSTVKLSTPPFVNVYISRCRKFPFDTEVCSIELSTGHHTMKRIDLRLKPDNPADADAFQPTSEWQLLNFTAHQIVRLLDTSLHGGNKERLRINEYRMVLRRYGWSQLFYTVLPILIIHTLAIIQFLLPCEAREKVNAAIFYYIVISGHFFITVFLFCLCDYH